MVSIADLAGILQAVLTIAAERAARASGMIRRQGKVPGANFVQPCVFGWLAAPEASYSQLAQTAATCGLAISPPGLGQRFTAAAAAGPKAVLAAALREAVAAAPVALPLPRRFNGVWLWDSTTVTLPAALAGMWPGGGGRVATNTRAALKVPVRWAFTTGRLELAELQAGRGSDRAAADAAGALPAGALRITDLGYVGLARLTALTAQGGLTLCRLPAHVVAFDRAARRRRQWRKAAKRAGRAASKARLALAGWGAYSTTAPRAQVAAAEALTLVRARGQIELLFKLWKQHGPLDEWRGGQPWRVLGEVYAKLLALLVQHWCLLLRCWAAPCRGLVKGAAVVRAHAVALAGARGVATRPAAALAVLYAALAAAGRVTKRAARPATAHHRRALAPPPEDLAAAFETVETSWAA